MQKAMGEPNIKATVRSFRRGGNVKTHIKAMELEPKILKAKKSVRRKALEFGPIYSKVAASRQRIEQTIMRWENDRQYEMLRRRMALGMSITPRREVKGTGKAPSKKDPSLKRL